ncbi:blue light receptor [Schizophyllum commune H4-8]|uniref:blue light receptor n=1 Tax=Schizophyllum commune (strain H4-8 / FGSC 9210) TaxID=578458 RepID=UPI00215E170D|nr:blue light receptor [Schizophyllum commune H4-8]KAI5888514.1 blue light receptor [Schizophyllum commune H4-8]
MPFEKYFQDGDAADAYSRAGPSNYQHISYAPTISQSPAPAGYMRAPLSHPPEVQLQIPPFVYSATPTLAPGGGAEVIPGSMFDTTGPSGSGWFHNNGFATPKLPHMPANATSNSYFPGQSNVSVHIPYEFDLPVQRQPTPPKPQQQQHHVEPVALPPAPFDEAGNAVLAPHQLLALSAPNPLNLPLYSASGFDLLSILARIASRPHPKVVLGPVDMTCSFAVVDVRRFDCPIIYCSPTFCALTGYSEREVVGKNCRFLQSPTGNQPKGEMRTHTSHEAVAHLKKSLVSDKECQTTIVNYRKDGRPFINLVTVIPLRGGISGSHDDDEEVVYHVGFQVDLTEQPNAILERLRDGSYIVNYSQSYGASSSSQNNAITPSHRDRGNKPIPTLAISKDLKKMLNDQQFVSSISISDINVDPSPEKSADASPITSSDQNQPLNLMLLEKTPDFVHVVSLKGSFLYVAPTVKRVLGYDPSELVGKGLSDICHPADVVPLMRELKEASSTGTESSGVTSASAGASKASAQQDPSMPRTVDLLFRAQMKTGRYVWMECRGRLHVEPGKGRKAIMLSGRAREMMECRWGRLRAGGGLAPSAVSPSGAQVPREFWGTLAAGAGGRAAFATVGGGVADVLGWDAADVLGRAVGALVCGGAGATIIDAEVARMLTAHQAQGDDAPRSLSLRMRARDGAEVDVRLVLYRPFAHRAVKHTVAPAPVIFQCASADAVASAGEMRHSANANVFEEFELARGTSWQYELQQVRYANQRLLDEIAVVEAQLGVQPSNVVYGSSSMPQQSAPSPIAMQQQKQAAMGAASSAVRAAAMVPPIITAVPQVQDWSAISVTTPQYGSARKRAWDSIDSGGG